MRYRHILAATDFSELGDLAVERAIELARDQEARLTLVHVLPEPVAPSPLVPHYFDVRTDVAQLAQAKNGALDALRARVRGELSVECEVAFGDPASEILAIESRVHPDLIVLATHGRRGFVHFVMGSVTERVLRGARADVLAVRPRPEE